MDLDDQGGGGSRLAAEPILPMVNLVFLLLVFLLAVASLAPRAPVPVDVPQVLSAEPMAPRLAAIALDARGLLSYRNATGSAAIALLAAEARRDGRRGVALHADRAARASTVARASAALTQTAIGPVFLVVEAQR